MGTTIRYKKNHRPIRFLHKTFVLLPLSKFKSHFSMSSVEKDFSKSMSSTILEFVCKILICESSHIILQTNLNFVVVSTLEYYRFNCYKLLFYKLWEFPHFLKLQKILCYLKKILVSQFKVFECTFIFLRITRLELLKNSIATINKTLQSTVSIQRKPIEN
ncbi:conserved hypothetical protein [Leptospira interrogans serovar Copenhageni str. Fiocruz L1-130]|uniref:Uncharacterized protein n=1 Tax=Leptospira interrogans serogroup Icterohaemorrhagiae serovar copenhageni (strain Fiocruz L1-130) TaxID=267671 RepID=Q72V16_LEPIC|nr:conserved hypothetical protein [Leptospira interrogans serovar Copenhageni str. Fiocruz L1-130]KPA32444.1 Uncharacterized protein AMR50_2925 [Leptospira interrogans]